MSFAVPIEVLPEIHPCSTCGSSQQTLESMHPEGRKTAVWRVVCTCRKASAQWSVSRPAAIRLWNRHMAEES